MKSVAGALATVATVLAVAALRPKAVPTPGIANVSAAMPATFPIVASALDI